MPLPPLENLLRSGLKEQAPNDREIENLIRSGEVRLNDAAKPELALESRFDLAYNAAHALALAALRHHGYRSENRYLVFQTLAQTPPSHGGNTGSNPVCATNLTRPRPLSRHPAVM